MLIDKPMCSRPMAHTSDNAVGEKDTLFSSPYLNQLLKIVCPLWVITKMFGCGCSVVQSDSLQPHGLQHARPPCPSLSSRVCPRSCPLSQWHYLSISSSAALFSFCLQFSQHQGPFQWAGCSYQIAHVLELKLQHQSFQWVFRVDFP